MLIFLSATNCHPCIISLHSVISEIIYGSNNALRVGLNKLWMKRPTISYISIPSRLHCSLSTTDIKFAITSSESYDIAIPNEVRSAINCMNA